MNKTCTFILGAFLFLSIGSTRLLGQFNISVVINGADVNTDCTDIFSGPDPMFSVNVENQGWVNYPDVGNCFTSLPNTQFLADYQCFVDVPLTLNICFRVFENDPNIFVDCDLNESCLEELCMDFPIPPQGSSDLALPITMGSSTGTLNFTIQTNGFPGGFNNFPCDALDFGVIDFNQSVGDTSMSIFNNFCTDEANEPNEFGTVGFWNNNGVWFEFTTGPDVGAVTKITAINDPSGLGDQVGMQLGLFNTTDGTCNTLNALSGSYNDDDLDETHLAYCLEPNETYFVLLDGDGVGNGDSLFGYFGLEIRDLGALEGADLICDADSLGVVPDGGSITSSLTSNGCATSSGDPIAFGMFNSKGVWFKFTPPSTGHINIDVISDPNNDDLINTEFALMESSDNTCSGTVTSVVVQSASANFSESIEVSCLNPELEYFILVDGQGLSATRSGVFQVMITDAGEDTPVFDQVLTLCPGEVLEVGTSMYAASGVFSDTIILANGCDSIVNSDLTILPDLILDLTIDLPGIGENMANGIATVGAVGGAGNYTYEWSNGETSPNVNNLIGDQNYCVSITDEEGCMVDTCFVQPLVLNFIPILEGDSLNCNGDINGSFSISANFGFPPYTFNWESDDGTFTGNGVLNNDGDSETFTDLPAGNYNVSIEDSMFDTVVVVQIWEPDPITLSMTTIENASCFGICNGSISIEIAGGTPPYITDWSNGINLVNSISNLCADSYNVVIADANGCAVIFDFEVTQPEEIIATAVQVQGVSCFEGSDGIAEVQVENANPILYVWDNGEMTPTITDLTGGIYQVLVLNSDSCFATASVEIETPDAPLEVNIQSVDPIVCNGGDEGSLSASVTGPGSIIIYQWSNGAVGAFNDNLSAGVYSVTATNENGCESVATFDLTEPDQIVPEFSTIGVTCPGGLTDGAIFIDTVVGGVGPYLYSSNGLNFTPAMELENLTAGLQSFYVSDALGCVQAFDALIEDVPDVQVDLGDDLSVELGDSLDITAVVSQPGLTFTWEPANLVDCVDCQKINTRPTEDAVLQVTVFDPVSECFDTDEIMIEVIKSRRFYAPNVFSPNDDGFNDRFVVFGDTDVQSVLTLKVFNRYGSLMFERDNFQPGDIDFGWDGFFNGQRLNPGVFTWFAQVRFLDGAIEIYRGDVTLVR